MNLFKLYRISGIVSLIIGIAAACCLVSISTLPYGLFFSIVGFILSGINVFLDAKHEFSGKKYPLGYAGMILSSLPVVFLMIMIFRH
jgi:hypothetical protein